MCLHIVLFLYVVLFPTKTEPKRYAELDIAFELDKQTERKRERGKDKVGYTFSSSYSLVANRLNNKTFVKSFLLYTFRNV
jgi:hypothetical protein